MKFVKDCLNVAHPFNYMKIKSKTQEKYLWYFSMCRESEPRPISRIPMDEKGVSAIESFHVFESRGVLPSCKEPELLEKFIQGKIWHGVTVENVAKSLTEGLVSSKELNEYPIWVKNEIIQQASKLSMIRIGWIPNFVKYGLP